MSILTGNATAGRKFIAGAGSPQGVVIGSIGDLYTDNTGGALYIKATGSATNTGWAAVGGSSPAAIWNLPRQQKNLTADATWASGIDFTGSSIEVNASMGSSWKITLAGGTIGDMLVITNVSAAADFSVVTAFPTVAIQSSTQARGRIFQYTGMGWLYLS